MKLAFICGLIVLIGVFLTISQPSIRKDTPEQLLPEIEAYMAAAKNQGHVFDPAFESDIHFVLGRVYYHYGEGVKGSEHLQKITHFRDKRRLIRPFMDLMLMSARRGHIDRVVERLQNIENAVAVIGEGRVVDTQKWVQDTLCGTAAKRLASKANYAGLDAVEKIPECLHIEQHPTIPEYRAAALIRDNRYIEGYETVADLPRAEISSLLFRACLPEKPDPEEQAKLLDYLEHRREEDFVDQINTAAIFLAFNKPDFALARLKKLKPEMYKPEGSK